MPLPRSNVTLALPEFETARSSVPFPSKSPTAIPKGDVPTANGLPVTCENPPEPSPSRTVTFWDVRFTTARSSLPSPLKSPVAIPKGRVPTAYGLPGDAVNPPAPSPSSTVTVASPELEIARSSLPSPLKSPITMPRGVVPITNGLPVTSVNAPAPLPSSTVTLLLSAFVTARSIAPSPLKSPATIFTGFVPVAKRVPWTLV